MHHTTCGLCNKSKDRTTWRIATHDHGQVLKSNKIATEWQNSDNLELQPSVWYFSPETQFESLYFHVLWFLLSLGRHRPVGESIFLPGTANHDLRDSLWLLDAEDGGTVLLAHPESG